MEVKRISSLSNKSTFTLKFGAAESFCLLFSEKK
jgi:hypothetical protein